MASPTPPQLNAAREQLAATLARVEARTVDLVAESWGAIEKSVIKVLGGAFDPRREEHQLCALGLAAALGERLTSELGAFWFPNRDVAEGAALGFPEALVTLAPFGAVVDALRSAKLERLEEVTKEIRGAVAQVKFGGGGTPRLGPQDYMRLFDPGFIQLVAIDPGKTASALGHTPTKLGSEVRDAFGRSAKLPPELKEQLLAAFQRLDPNTPLRAQVARAPRVAELVAMLFGATGSTGLAPEEFWMDVVFPLLLIGSPEAFPELDEEELAAARQGIDPLFLFLDVVPHRFPAPDDGLLGAFPGESLAAPTSEFEGAGSLRLIRVGPEVLRPPLGQFDAAKTREALVRFSQGVRAKTGPVQARGEDEAKQMLEAALALLGDTKKVVDTAANQALCVRRLTEAEAFSDPALAQLRQVLQGPRIILSA